MAKVAKGRLSGVDGMDRHTSSELLVQEQALRMQAIDSRNTDDPKWLRRRADRIASLAEKKEKAVEHKRAQSRERSTSSNGKVD